MTIPIDVVIETEHWLKRKVFYISPQHLEFFPTDALGARGKEEKGQFPERGHPVDFDFGIVKTSCDIATRKNGTMRLRESGPVGQFYDATRAKVGDVIRLSRVGERSYKVTLMAR